MGKPGARGAGLPVACRRRRPTRACPRRARAPRPRPRCGGPCPAPSRRAPRPACRARPRRPRAPSCAPRPPRPSRSPRPSCPRTPPRPPRGSARGRPACARPRRAPRAGAPSSAPAAPPPGWSPAPRRSRPCACRPTAPPRPPARPPRARRPPRPPRPPPPAPGPPFLVFPAALVAVHDLDRPVDLRLGHLGGDQRLAAARGLGELARVVPAEAAGDDLAHELVLAALQDRDVPLREAGLHELLDHPAGGLPVERADDGRRHLSVSLCRLFVCCSRDATPGAGPSVGLAVPGLGRVEALDDGLLAPERHPLLGVAGGGAPGDPDPLGGAQALLHHPHLPAGGD